MNTTNRIRVFSTKSSNVRLYAVTVELLSRDESVDLYVYRDIIPAIDDNGNQVQLPTRTIVANDILALQGVTHVRIRRHEIHVTIAAAFDWTDGIEDTILEILENRLFDEPVQIQRSPITSSDAA